MTRRQRHEEHEGHAEGHAADLETAENGPSHKWGPPLNFQNLDPNII